MLRTVSWVSVVLWPVVSAAAAEVGFASPPVATKAAAGVRITFTASAATDVAVAILDANGKTVRHLAAGVLGENAPEPLTKGALAQELLWDGNDDRGRPAAGGPFSVRVGLGLRPAFGGLIGYDPLEGIDSVRGIATDADGNVFVLYSYAKKHAYDNSGACIMLNRDGEYVRQIIPYPADLPAAKRTSLKRIRVGETSVPFLYQVETRSILPGVGEVPIKRPVVTPDGKLVFGGVLEIGRYNSDSRGSTRIAVVNTDGGVPETGVLATKLSGSGPRGASLALGPDGKTFYATSVRTGGFLGKPTHAVYRFTLTDAAAAVFLGTPGEAGKDESHFNDPRGVAVDAEGTLYVADRGNDRIAVFDAAGKHLGEMAVEKPACVEVDRVRGTLYVLGGKHYSVLSRFTSWRDAKPTGTLRLRTNRNPHFRVAMALDATGGRPILWLGNLHRLYGLLRVEVAEDGSFAKPRDVIPRRRTPRGLGRLFDISLNKRTGALMMTNDQRYNGRYLIADSPTANAPLRREVNIRQGDHGYLGPGSFGLDGNLYCFLYYTMLARYSGQFKLLPFTVNNSPMGFLKTLPGSTWRIRPRGITADADGNVYVLLQKPLDEINNKKGAGAHTALCVYAPDGSVKKQWLIDSDTRYVSSPRLDPAGNVYLMLGARPGDALLPPGLAGQVPADRKDPQAVRGVNGYPLIYGSIVKFGPDGGSIKLIKRSRLPEKGVPVNYGFGHRGSVDGAKWIVPGASPVVSFQSPGAPDMCKCESSRFDVDGFGRSFFPDAGRFRVGVIDTNGNQICWFGSYGNQDSAGPGSAIPTPEIPLLWAYGVTVGDRAAFVADRLNRRVVRVKLAYAAEGSAVIPSQ